LIAIFDADDICYPNRLREQLEYFAQHPAIDVVGGQLEIIDEASRHIGWRQYPLDHDSIVRTMRRYNPLAQPSVMFRKEVVMAAGGYQFTKQWGEDYDLWSRLAKSGARFANHPDPLIQYRIHSGSTKNKFLRQAIRNTIEIKTKYWRDSMNWGDWLRMQAERALLVLPPSLVARLFRMVQYQSQRPSHSGPQVP
jgi:hypothetical protein